MSFLKTVNNSAKVENEKDVLGGSFILPTDVYEMTVDAAYITEAASGALAVNLRLIGDNGVKYNETMYITNKNKETSYTKDGKNYSLPGFSIANAIAGFAVGKEITDLTEETKTIKIYNFDEKKEMATDVPCLVELHGKKICVGIVQKTENKSVKNSTTGKYDPTNEKRQVNNIERVFDPVTHKTAAETREGLDAEFCAKWLEKNKGVTVDRFKEVAGTPAAAARPASVFGSK
jgi:hypothetical protein